LGVKGAQAALQVWCQMVGLNPILRWKLRGLSSVGDAGIPGVGVKSVDIWKNTNGEGKHLGMN
jgi:hypothetical protein